MWFFNSLQEDITFGSMIVSTIIVAIILGYKQNKILMPFGMVLFGIIPALFSGYQMSCFVDGDCAYLAWFYTVLVFLSSIVYVFGVSMIPGQSEQAPPPVTAPAAPVGSSATPVPPPNVV